MILMVPNHCSDDHPMVLGAIINWNGWCDTKICVQSLFEISAPAFQLVICDNGSSDDSFENLSSWLRNYVAPNPKTYFDFNENIQTLCFEGPFSPALKSIHLLRLPENIGYAGALNRCITWGRQALVTKNFWLLNNDVKVHPDALARLVVTARSAPDIGLCGSVLLDWDHPESVQAIGGIYQRYLAVGRHMKELPVTVDSDKDVLFDIDYPVGASLFVTNEYLEAVGLMDAAYFLYYEEMDWAERGRRLGFRPAVALRSLVQHKEGASTGSHGGVRNKSLLSERYGVINRLRITRKFWPLYLPIVWMSLWLVALDRVINGEWVRARLVLKLMFSPQKWLSDRRPC